MLILGETPYIQSTECGEDGGVECGGGCLTEEEKYPEMNVIGDTVASPLVISLGRVCVSGNCPLVPLAPGPVPGDH